MCMVREGSLTLGIFQYSYRRQASDKLVDKLGLSRWITLQPHVQHGALKILVKGDLKAITSVVTNKSSSIVPVCLNGLLWRQHAQGKPLAAIRQYPIQIKMAKQREPLI